MSVADRYTVLRSNPATANAGYGWSVDEVRRLEEELKTGTSLQDISVAHNRTVGGVAVQCRKLAIKAVSTKRLSLENSSKHYQTPAEKIQERLNLRQTPPQKTKRTSLVGDAMVARLILRMETMETTMNEQIKKLKEDIEELQNTVAELETNQE